jgi:hypothetical protein
MEVERMKSAKEMFEELDYKPSKFNKKEFHLEYEKDLGMGGVLCVTFHIRKESKYYKKYAIHNYEITHLLHQAIGEQLKELGWLDD